MKVSISMLVAHMAKYSPQDGPFSWFLDPDYFLSGSHNYGYDILSIFMIEVCTPIHKDYMWEIWWFSDTKLGH